VAIQIGRIQGEETHLELLVRRGAYFNLYNQRFEEAKA
jgi:hypothetical protein